MITILRKFVKNKYFLIWTGIFVILTIFIAKLFATTKSNYMVDLEMTNPTYLLFAELLPLAFADKESAILAILLDFCYLSLISYVMLSFIDYFLNKNTQATFTRIGRDKWFKELIFFSNFYAIIIFLLYLYLVFMGLILVEKSFTFNLQILVALLIKLEMTLIIPNIYLFIYLKTKNSMLSTIFYISFYVILQIFAKLSFVKTTLKFKYWFVIITTYLIFLILSNKLCKIKFRKEDLG